MRDMDIVLQCNSVKKVVDIEARLESYSNKEKKIYLDGLSDGFLFYRTCETRLKGCPTCKKEID